MVTPHVYVDGISSGKRSAYEQGTTNLRERAEEVIERECGCPARHW